MRYFPLALVVAALCCAVRADWLSWSGGGDGGLTAIPRETGDVSYASDGWSPKITAAPTVVQSDGERVLEILQRGDTASSWINAETCGWISGSESSSFGCGDNGTCVTNDNHIVACATGTYSPFYSMCLNYDAYTSGSCKNDDSSTGCCMSTDFPECVTYLWVDPPQRSMYRCWKSKAVITMLDKPEIIEDQTTYSTTSSAVPRVDGTSTDSNNDNNWQPSIGLQIGAVLGTLAGILLVAFGCYRCHKCHLRHTLATANDHDDVRAHLDSLFRNGVIGHTEVRTTAQGGIVSSETVAILRRGAESRRLGLRDEIITRPRTAAQRNHHRTRRTYPQLIDHHPQTPDQSRIHSRNRHGYIHLDHVNPTSSTAAMYGSPPNPPSYDMHLESPRLRAPGGTYTEAVAAAMALGAANRRVETPPPTYQPGFLSDSTLGFGGLSTGGLAREDSQPNWIELSRSSPTLPAAARRATMWPFVGNERIPESSTWQDVSGSVLSREGEDETMRSGETAVAAEEEEEEEEQPVFGSTRRGFK
ncbi:uncharacterized protein GGS22DRAFT_21505 [Annulohypoxylon maeteangense]|uniref:uncharacterized protein n=1 Tax=Annulohypoxylon maeteangense TaxID=1927788 RepID=UPI0020087C95|nr:uncharacterized protein GGS22DRAFT_21505 [Annulohypoxylon maeteangense]KAI0884281.1 hypothetical protein GGS22DRAFT_21505 [Annulohypoxylon maeteangense]